MFKKILVALDMSSMADDVFAKAVLLAKTHQSKLFLIHIISSEEDNSPLPVPSDIGELYPASGNELTLESWQKQWNDYIRQGLNMLTSYHNQAEESEIESEYYQCQGSPSRTICQLAKEYSCDLIVIGRRGRTGLSEMLLGSVSNYVLHHAHCSVLTIQKSTDQK